ncbi:NACHT domain-containing protein [Nonomuraea sediminis]|uniref:NACHT domain-containing protein n=1 Tax=Nonomuraea sediminis TaxID=2835864 RepID=UPI001BDD09F5|nr:hypothetical protein [Nonomuraea sediminis]
MSRRLSYADAAKLLGGGDGAIVTALDRAAGGVLLAATGGGADLALNLFDAKGELARLSHQLVSGLGERLRGLNRFDRTERLVAAQRVLVLTAYFDTVRGLELPALGRAGEVAVATGHEIGSGRIAPIARILLASDIPGHSPRDRRHSSTDELLAYYRSIGEDLLEGFDAEAAMLLEEVPETAARRYDELFARLAAEFPEVAFWAGRLDHEGTRDELRTGMARLGQVLDRIAAGRAPDERREALARTYRRQLERPVVATGDVPDGLTIPSLAGAYVNPDYRVAPVIRADRLDEESWWSQYPVRDDLQDYLIGHLTSLHAVECPLIVLGQPGSGKSVLTRVLSARLPPSDFMVVRVALREVPADADLQTQIEYAIRQATGERLSWPALARAAGDALPVILLDGFDELVQAANIGQSDYLEQVVRFQEREADQGRPLAVIVTSRTAVADRARIPPGGAVAIRLEPFTPVQVERWLRVWNGDNQAFLAAQGLEPLSAEAALRRPELATQPLLLLMLALYDADGNALQRDGQGLDPADLYGRILARFAEREIHKSDPGLPDTELPARVEQELLHLSVAAFAMFNRSRQWVTEAELSQDLGALLGESALPGQQVIGRFFFVHEAQAIRDEQRLTTCEFLHATFGEFLVARLIARELATLPDEGLLRRLLCYVPLTRRGPVMDFLAALTRWFLPPLRERLRERLLDLFHHSLEDLPRTAYEPVHRGVPLRHAAYSANLVLLATLVGEPIRGRELFPAARYPTTEWRRCAMLWRSQFSGEGWRGYAAALKLERIWYEGDREIVLSMGPWSPPPLDAYWANRMSPGHPLRESPWRRVPTAELRRESYLTCDTAEDTAWHALEPLGDHVSEFAGPRSHGHALTSLFLTSARPCPPEELAAAYDACVGEGGPHLSLVLRQLAADRDRLPPADRARLLPLFARDVLAGELTPEASRWAVQAFGDVGWTPAPPGQRPPA